MQALGSGSRAKWDARSFCMMITALNIKHLSAAVFRPYSLRAYRRSAPVLMTSQTGTQLDKSTPDNKWKEILSTEQVWSGAVAILYSSVHSQDVA